MAASVILNSRPPVRLYPASDLGSRPVSLCRGPVALACVSLVGAPQPDLDFQSNCCACPVCLSAHPLTLSSWQELARSARFACFVLASSWCFVLDSSVVWLACFLSVLMTFDICYG